MAFKFVPYSLTEIPPKKIWVRISCSSELKRQKIIISPELSFQLLLTMYYIYVFNIFTGKIFKVKCPTMTDSNLYLLTHPENWPHKGLLPVIRRGGNIVYNKTDAGIIMEDDLCCVWIGNYLGECDPRKGVAERYGTLEEVLTEWAID